MEGAAQGCNGSCGAGVQWRVQCRGAKGAVQGSNLGVE